MPGEQEQRVARRIRDVLESAATRYWVKMVLELALLRDPLEAADDAKIMADLLKEWCTGIVQSRPSLEACERAVSSIEKILMTHEHSDWLRTALQLALHRDPVDAAADAEMLCDLLGQRCSAALGFEAAQGDHEFQPSAQLRLHYPGQAR